MMTSLNASEHPAMEEIQELEHELRTDQIWIPNVLRIHFVHFLVDISEFTVYKLWQRYLSE